MRHRIAGKKLNRDIKHRKTLFKNLINALIIHEEIKTTETKAKAIKRLVDKVISSGKKGTLHARRTIAAFLQNKKAVNKIVDELGPRFINRIGGFTRIVRIGKRRGDDAMLVKMELVQKSEAKKEKKIASGKELKVEEKKDLRSKDRENKLETKKEKK